MKCFGVEGFDHGMVHGKSFFCVRVFKYVFILDLVFNDIFPYSRSEYKWPLRGLGDPCMRGWSIHISATGVHVISFCKSVFHENYHSTLQQMVKPGYRSWDSILMWLEWAKYEVCYIGQWWMWSSLYVIFHLLFVDVIDVNEEKLICDLFYFMQSRYKAKTAAFVMSRGHVWYSVVDVVMGVPICESQVSLLAFQCQEGKNPFYIDIETWHIQFAFYNLVKKFVIYNSGVQHLFFCKIASAKNIIWGYAGPTSSFAHVLIY